MSSLRTTSVSVMRPPKPPCWRDFVSPTPKSSTQSEGVDMPDPVGRPLGGVGVGGGGGARSPISELVEPSRGGSSSVPGIKPTRLARRPRARIHRTRSEHVIDAQDLPESAFTATLAEADPKGVRVRRPVEYDGRLYVEENNRRCQNWLASIEACEPLDEVDYASSDTKTSGSPRITPEPPAIPVIGANVEPAPPTNDSSCGGTTVVEHSSSSRLRDDRENVPRRRAHPNLIPIHDLGQSVEVEVPEETFVWSVPREVPPPSSSSGDECCCSCTKSSTPRGEDKKKATITTITTTATTITSGIINLTSVGEHRKSAEETSKRCRLKPAAQSQVHEAVVDSSSGKPSGSVSRATSGNNKKPHKPSCDVSNPSYDNNISTSSGPPRKESKRHNNSKTSNSFKQEEETIQEESPAPRRLCASAKRTSSQSVLCDTELWALDQSD